jgi:hypothetical protein
MFDMMTAKSYVYGFRNCAFEMQEVEGLWSKYARSQSITPQRQFFGKGLMCGVSQSLLSVSCWEVIFSSSHSLALSQYA